MQPLPARPATTAGGGWSPAGTVGTRQLQVRELRLAINEDLRLELFAIGRNDDLVYHTWQRVKNGPWDGPEEMVFP